MWRHFVSILVWACTVLPLCAQQFTVSPDQVTVMAENAIAVRIESCDCNAMQVRSDNGKIKRTGDCLYKLIPLWEGVANITVSRVEPSGKVVDVGIKSLIVTSRKGYKAGTAPKSNGGGHRAEPSKPKAPPEPVFTVTLAGRGEGVLRIPHHLKNAQLQLLSDQEQVLNQARIEIFTVNILEGDVLLFEKTINGNSLDKESVLQIFQQNNGNRLLLSGIKVRYNGKLYAVKDIIFDLKK